MLDGYEGEMVDRAVESASAQTPDRPDAEPWTRRRMLREIADLVDGGLPAPTRVELWRYREGGTSVDIQLDEEATDEVDAWAAWAESTATTSVAMHAPGQAPFRAYEFAAAVPWPGWKTLKVECYIRESTEGGESR